MTTVRGATYPTARRAACDLFAGARDEQAIPRTALPAPRTVLPADLPSALKRLPESDLKRLAEALAVEMRRRNLVPAPAARSVPEPEKPKSKRKAAVPSGRDESAGPGKINAIRASVKAGVKPMAIARQFGVSLSAIKKALKGLER